MHMMQTELDPSFFTFVLYEIHLVNIRVMNGYGLIGTLFDGSWFLHHDTTESTKYKKLKRKN